MEKSQSLAAILKEPKNLCLEMRDIPNPGEDEVLVEVKACAICGSDFHLIDGHTKRARLPVVPGHELMGKVVDVGKDVSKDIIGNRVCIENHVACGECRYCKSNRENLCNNSRSIGTTIDGGYSQHVIAPANKLVPIPDKLDDATASVMQTLATGYHVVNNRANLKKDETAAIIGVGPIGLCTLACAKQIGARVIAIDTVGDRLSLAKKMGADETINAMEVDPVEKVKVLTDGEGAEVSFEIVGGNQSKTIQQSIDMLCKGGRTVIVGVSGIDIPIDFQPIQHLEKVIIGSRGHPYSFQPCIDHVVSGNLNVSDMITHQIPLSMVKEGIKMMRERKDGAVKVVLIPNK